MNLQLTWHDSLRACDFPRQDYEALRLATSCATPFNSLAWLDAAERALRADQHLAVLCLWQSGRLALCLPLLRQREKRIGLPLTVVRHLGFPLADRVGLVATPEGLRALGQVLPAIRSRLPHALLQLNELSGPTEGLNEWARRSWYAYSAISCRVPVRSVLESDRQEPTGDLRYKLRRASRRCAAAGAAIRRVRPTPGDIRFWLDALDAVEAESWKGEQKVGIFASDTRGWVRDALSHLAAEGQVAIVALEIEDRIVSYRLGLIHAGRWYDYNLAYLPEHSDLGSGRLLLDEVIRWALDEGWSHVDASRVSLSGSRHQLFERSTEICTHLRWSFYSLRPAGVLHGVADWLWQALKPRLMLLRKWRSKRPRLFTQGKAEVRA